MLYVKFRDSLPVDISTHQYHGSEWQSRNDWKTFEDVVRISSYLTAMTGITYLPTDSGSGCYPRYDIIAAPRVGDEVSYSFNGDTTPCGTIVRITPTWQVTTSTGKKFTRRPNSGSWRTVGGTWSMVHGHISERNPSF